MPLNGVNVTTFDAVNVLRVHEVHERLNFQPEQSGYKIVSICWILSGKEFVGVISGQFGLQVMVMNKSGAS